ISPTAHWTLQATVRVGGGRALTVPAPATVGGWTWELTAIETPNAIEVVAIVHGATVDQVSGPRQRPLTLAGPEGADAPVLSEGASVTVPKQQLNVTTAKTTRVQAIWLRGADGTYRLTINTPTGQQMIPITVRCADCGLWTALGGAAGEPPGPIVLRVSRRGRSAIYATSRGRAPSASVFGASSPPRAGP